MASIDVKKLHGESAVAHILGHASRWDGRDVQYGNEHIDKSRSCENETRVFRGMPKEKRFRDTADRLRKRVVELDSEHPPKRIRADRVTEIAFTIPVPAGLPSEREMDFFQIAYSEIAKWCGGVDKVSPIYIHRDEVHEYVNSATKEVCTSRVHGHVVGIPWTEEHGVNAKNAVSKNRLGDLQRAVDRRCREELGVAYLVGGEKSRAEVEELKVASLKVASDALKIAQDDAREADRHKLALEAENARLRADIARLRATRGDLEEQNEALLDAKQRLMPYLAVASEPKTLPKRILGNVVMPQDEYDNMYKLAKFGRRAQPAVEAKRMSDAIISNAEKIEADAQAEAERIVRQAQKEAQSIDHVLEMTALKRKLQAQEEELKRARVLYEHIERFYPDYSDLMELTPDSGTHEYDHDRGYSHGGR